MQHFMDVALKGYSLLEIGIFITIVFVALFIDLYSHKRDEPISLKNATIWSIIWVGVSILFGCYIYQAHGSAQASMFFSGYFLEKSLSVDNLFVFMAIFTSFGITDKYQHRILYFGILGAIILRLIFISLGSSLLFLGDWVLFIFGLIVLWSAYQMFKASDNENEEIDDYTNHWSVILTEKFINIHPHKVGHNFFTTQNNKLMVTPLFLCLLVIEIFDIMFAFDSVPAVIAITREPFLIYTSNIFAILGLRSMYFLLSAAKRYLCYLEKAVICILLFIGFKLILGFFNVHISPILSLFIVLGSLSIGIITSIIFPNVTEEQPTN